MKNSRHLLQIDSMYRSTIEHLPDNLIRDYKQVVDRGQLPLKGCEVTKAILLRMRAFYRWQDGVKAFLGRRKNAAGADFFVETVLFYLKALNDTYGLGLEVASEKPVRRRRGALRPDVSLWAGEELLASIECKTQLGWQRAEWRSDFALRRQLLQADFPRTQIFLVAMTSENWEGFRGREVGRHLFALSRIWPTKIINAQIEDVIETPIELLFRHVLQISKPAHG